MRTNSSLPILQSAVKLAHHYWEQLLLSGSTVIDATCGNGKDTIQLLKMISPTGKIFACDIQEEAIARARKNIESELSLEAVEQVCFIHGCHSLFPKEIEKDSVHLVVYNLGYLPGADKTCVTQSDTTLKSIQSALHLVKVGGALSIICYPGHAGGDEEESLIHQWSTTLSPEAWIICRHVWCNRNKAPSLIFIVRIA
jgi:methylase of polypeptide subunit release factors